MSAAKSTDPEPAQHENLASALAAFQAELPRVAKGATGQVPGKKTYKYADLSDLSATVLPLLGKHGLSWMAMPTMTGEGMLVLHYELLHTSGDSRTGDFPLHGSDNWSISSSLTYARRFCLSAVTGVAADEDDDGAAGNESGPAQARPAQQRQNGQQRKPDGPSPDELRKTVAGIAKAKGTSYEKLAGLYLQGTQRDLDHEGDPARIQQFIDAVHDGRVPVQADDPAGASS